MKNSLLIAKKELKTYFSSPIAYVTMTAFLVFTGLLFVDSLSGAFREASLRGFLAGQSSTRGLLGETIDGAFVLLLLGPVLTMRLIAEESKLGTIELLLTSPVRDTEVVVGKFVAAFGALLVLLALTLYYPILLWIFATPDKGPIISGYLGMVLIGGFFVSVGLFASSLSSSQIASAVVGMVILLMFWFINSAADFFSGRPERILQFVSPRAHFADFARGIIDSGAVIYLIALTAIFLFLTIRSLETRRWR
ncbi:MAG: ABC transporter permease subunit [Chloroflexi bacterium]|nr:ABC transporter permease subunit [Chloroflexota bacterium]